jgi:ABC-type transporter Mla MlaB component
MPVGYTRRRPPDESPGSGVRSTRLARPCYRHIRAELQQTGDDVGIFSIFKRKNAQPQLPAAPDNARLRGEPSRLSLDNEAERARQREIARATAAKIDAIESAMALDIFNEAEPAWGSTARRPPSSTDASSSILTELAATELATRVLLADVSELPAAAVVTGIDAVVDESAVLYANDQLDAAEQLLVSSLTTGGRTDRRPWWMLFDLYQASGREDAFDDIAIDYASHFETSAPGWTPLAPPRTSELAFAGVTPTAAFAGVLDATIDAQLQRLLQPEHARSVIRLEFGHVRQVTPEGCARLLAALCTLRAARRALVVAGAEELAILVRPTLVIGLRDASAAPWLLLLELLQLMNREKEFEETAMDYCVTYEVSPPSFQPADNVATAAAPQAPTATDRFMLPSLVAAATGAALFSAIDAYAAQSGTVVLDCSRLARVDFPAAIALLERLQALAAAGHRIELRDLNHLVAALFRLLGYADVARLYPHKY